MAAECNEADDDSELRARTNPLSPIFKLNTESGRYDCATDDHRYNTHMREYADKISNVACISSYFGPLCLHYENSARFTSDLEVHYFSMIMAFTGHICSHIPQSSQISETYTSNSVTMIEPLGQTPEHAAHRKQSSLSTLKT